MPFDRPIDQTFANVAGRLYSFDVVPPLLSQGREQMGSINHDEKDVTNGGYKASEDWLRPTPFKKKCLANGGLKPSTFVRSLHKPIEGNSAIKRQAKYRHGSRAKPLEKIGTTTGVISSQDSSVGCPKQDAGGKTFVIGMFKTGTTSMTAALLMMGGACVKQRDPKVNSCGFNEVLNISQTDWFADDIAVKVGQSDRWAELVKGASRATVHADGPWLFMYKQMDKLYPFSKFILTTRDVLELAESDVKMWERLGNFDRLRKEVGHQYNGTDSEFGAWAKAWLRQHVQQRYEHHNAAVRHFFRDRKCDLLEWDITTPETRPVVEVWSTLAKFTGLVAPPGNPPFPKLNTKHNPGFSGLGLVQKGVSPQ